MCNLDLEILFVFVGLVNRLEDEDRFEIVWNEFRGRHHGGGGGSVFRQDVRHVRVIVEL